MAEVMEATEVGGATEVEVAAAKVEAVWQRVVGELEGRSREFRGFRVGMQVVLLGAQEVEEQRKERVWAGWLELAGARE